MYYPILSKEISESYPGIIIFFELIIVLLETVPKNIDIYIQRIEPTYPIEHSLQPGIDHVCKKIVINIYQPTQGA